MRWRGRRQSDNVEDRRGQRGGAGGGLRFPFPMGRGGGSGGGGRRGGFSIVTLLIIGAIYLFFGGNLGSLLGGGGGGTGGGLPGNVNFPRLDRQAQGQEDSNPFDIKRLPRLERERSTRSGRPEIREANSETVDEIKGFLGVVLADTEDVWQKQFASIGRRYEPTTLVLFSGSTRTGCGAGQAAMGPFYCPLDKKVYVDTSFFNELKHKFGASGDFAQAYVIAHEVGHHIQTLVGIAGKVQRAKQGMGRSRANQLQVRMELQADCLAGVWAKNADQAQQILERGDIEEALNAATAIGDDRIQKRTQGYVVPDSFTHGTSEQRKRWFYAGFKSGSMGSCDTFNRRDL